ncbi:MAG: hypothetical protein K5871_01835 [Lachnospiraceae bacterium]|nr:hypothetical protein [Lachnospiraceae bacterium]
MKNERNSKLIVSFGIFLFFLFISYGITSYSSTLTHATECGDLDSYCYRYVGMVMARGGIPYLDAFDNKGPLLYLLNCIGYLIGKKHGVFAVEFIFMLFYLAVQYAIARRFADIKRSLIYTFAALGPIGAFFLGNMTEEYALLFISIGILVFVDYFLFDKRDLYRITICGVSCGAVLMLRPNMVAVWAVFCIYCILTEIREKKSFPLKTASFFLLGVMIAVIPFLVWLAANGAIGEFWKDYMLTNMNYSSEYSSAADILASFKSYLLGSISEVYMLLLVFLIIKKENTGFNIAYLLFMIINILVMSLSGKGFEHYGMVTVPALVYPLSASSDVIKKQLKKRSYLFDAVSLLTSVILSGYIFNNYFTTVPALVSGGAEEPRNARILEIIEEYTEPDDRILVLGYKDYYYVESDRLASTKFHLFNSINENYPGGLEAVTEDINTVHPRLVIAVQGFEYEYLGFDFEDYVLIDEELNVWMLDERVDQK